MLKRFHTPEQQTHSDPPWPMTRYRFDPHTFDTVSFELFRGDEPVAIRFRTAELLTFFLENRDRLLSKDELLDQVWKDAVVGDAVLFQTISDLRRVLGDSARQPLCIETLEKRGYRWISQPTEIIEEPPAATATPTEVAPKTATGMDIGSDSEPNLRPDRSPSPHRSGVSMRLRPRLVFGLGVLIFGLFLALRYSRPAPEANLQLALLPFENATGLSENAWAEFGLRAVVATLMESVEGLEVESIEIPASARSSAPRAELEALATALDVDVVIATRFRIIEAQSSESSGSPASGELYRLDAQILSPGSKPRTVRVEGYDLTDCAEQLASNLAEQTHRLGAPESAESLLSGNPEAIRAYGMGRQSLDMGEPEAARLFLEKALHLDATMTWARIDLARSLEELGDVGLGERETWTALGEAEQRLDVRQKDACLANLARIATRKGELDRATDFRRRVLDSAKDRADPRQIARAMVELAETLRQRGDLDQAMEILVEARRIMASANHSLGIADCETRMGGVEYLRRRPATAESHFEEALKIYRGLGHRWRETEVLSSLGLVAAELGELEDSERLHRQALDLARQLGNPRALTHSLNNLGVFAFDQGRFEEARDFYLEALEVASASDRRANQISISFNLAEVYLKLGDRDNGRPHLERCRQYFEDRQGYRLALSVDRADLQDLVTRYEYAP